jgi:hypothetical protein
MMPYNRNIVETDVFLRKAFNNYFFALESMTKRFKIWVSNANKVKPLFEEMTILYNFDELISSEYFGLSSLFSG